MNFKDRDGNKIELNSKHAQTPSAHKLAVMTQCITTKPDPCGNFITYLTEYSDRGHLVRLTLVKCSKPAYRGLSELPSYHLGRKDFKSSFEALASDLLHAGLGQEICESHN